MAHRQRTVLIVCINIFCHFWYWFTHVVLVVVVDDVKTAPYNKCCWNHLLISLCVNICSYYCCLCLLGSFAICLNWLEIINRASYLLMKLTLFVLHEVKMNQNLQDVSKLNSLFKCKVCCVLYHIDVACWYTSQTWHSKGEWYTMSPTSSSMETLGAMVYVWAVLYMKKLNWSVYIRVVVCHGHLLSLLYIRNIENWCTVGRLSFCRLCATKPPDQGQTYYATLIGNHA